MIETAAPSARSTWVVGIDGSDASNQALDWASRHVDGRADHLRVIAAWEPSYSGPNPPDDPDAPPVDLPAKTAAHDIAEAGVHRAAEHTGADVSGEAIHGGASAVLLDAADGARLLVVGSRGRGGFKRLVLGSTSTQTVTHAETPTVVVRGDDDPHDDAGIIVGYDGSDSAAAAVEWALGFAPPGSNVTIAMATDQSHRTLGLRHRLSTQSAEEQEAAFDRYVDELVDSIDGRVRISRSFSVDSPRDHLADLAADAALLVVGARGSGALSAALVGSVATWVLHHVTRPTAIIPSE